MQYPEILSIIDSKLEQLNQARALLTNQPAIAMPELEGEPLQAPAKPSRVSTTQSRPRTPRRVSVLRDLQPANEHSSEQADAHARALPAILPDAAVNILQQPNPATVVAVVARPARAAVARFRQQVPQLVTALNGLAPAAPVAVSAVEAQRMRAQKEAAQRARQPSGKSSEIPPLSAEYLTQQWLKKGNSNPERAMFPTRSR
jgi:hypothetical protein